MSDQPSITTTTLSIGHWDHEGAPHRAPWEEGPHVAVHPIWEDASRAVVVAIEDHDGCRALVEPEP